MAGKGTGAVLNAEEWKKRIRDAFQLFEHKEGSNETVERCARPLPPLPPSTFPAPPPSARFPLSGPAPTFGFLRRSCPAPPCIPRQGIWPVSCCRGRPRSPLPHEGGRGGAGH